MKNLQEIYRSFIRRRRIALIKRRKEELKRNIRVVVTFSEISGSSYTTIRFGNNIMYEVAETRDENKPWVITFDQVASVLSYLRHKHRHNYGGTTGN